MKRSRKIRRERFGEPRCVVCGCTQNNACDGGCWWVAGDLCSACEEAWKQAVALLRKLSHPRNRVWSLDRKRLEAARRFRALMDSVAEAVGGRQ